MIKVSQVAVQEIRRLQGKQKESSRYIRLDVTRGGCSDWTYALGFEAEATEYDLSFEDHGILLLVSRDVLPYINGLTIDYSEDLMGGGFRFNNPNAYQQCGCGNSFSLTPGADVP